VLTFARSEVGRGGSEIWSPPVARVGGGDSYLLDRWAVRHVGHRDGERASGDRDYTVCGDALLESLGAGDLCRLHIKTVDAWGPRRGGSADVCS
jgi:hypothetical protein